MQGDYTKQHLGADHRSAARADTTPEARKVRQLAGAQLAYDICRRHMDCGDAAEEASEKALLASIGYEDLPLYEGTGGRAPGAPGAGGPKNKSGAKSKSGTCANSFVPGTKVLMADGSHKPIGQVQVGDSVLATDPISGRTEAKPVVALISSEDDKDLVEITVDTTAGRATRPVCSPRQTSTRSGEPIWGNGSMPRT